ncbi:MAG: class I SAM-dependent methyltransferase [Candidatus Marinimicrobia bacterium]|nr:class I SAM-dependent methyltransferase [Candidatus Neomarinimicrobiota bacterium]
MNQMITTKAVKTYYDNFLEHLKYDHIRQNPRHTKIKKDLSGIIKKDMNVLDLGCGTGITTHYIAGLGAKVIGVDLSPKLIEFARENSAHENAEYRVGDITSFDLGKKTFDVICLIDVMEHIPREKIQGLIKTINKYTHQNTIIYLNIPDARFQVYMRGKLPDRLQIIDEAYSIEEILVWFNKIKFEAINIDIYGVDMPIQYVSFKFMKGFVIFYNYEKYLI